MITSLEQLVGNWTAYMPSGEVFISGNATVTYLNISTTATDLVTRFYSGINTQILPIVESPGYYSRNFPLSELTIQNGVVYAYDFPLISFDQCGNLLFSTLVFYRVEQEPASFPAYRASMINWADPTVILKYFKASFYDKLNQNSFGLIEQKPYHDAVYKFCQDKADSIVELVLSNRGYSKSVEVKTFYRTINPANSVTTTVILKGPNPFNAANKVTISGLTNEWAVVNGEHFISVILGNLNFPATLTDVTSDSSYVYIFFNTNSLPEYDPTKHGNCIYATAYQPPITPTSEFAEMMGAVMDVYITAGPYVHNEILSATLQSGGANISQNYRLARTYAEFTASSTKNDLVMDGGRFGQHIAPFYGGNSLDAAWNVNNKYNIPTTAVSSNIPRNNYLAAGTNSTMWWRSAVAGVNNAVLIALAVSTQGLLDLPKLYGVNQVLEFTISQVNVTPPNPPPNTNTWTQYSNTIASIGLIRPDISNGKTIGYLQVRSYSQLNSVLGSPAFPGVAANFDLWKLFLGAYAVFTKQLLDWNISELIIDSRYNGGGFPYQAVALASLFGTDRDIYEAFRKSSWKDQCASIIPFVEPLLSSPDQAATLDKLFNPQVRPSVAEELFGNVVIKNINIHFLTSIYSISAGQILQIQMQGECLNGDIGASTHVTFVGDMNNLLAGLTIFNAVGIPRNPSGPNLSSSTNSLFSYRYESVLTLYREHQKIMTTHYLNQLAPTKVLPHDWDIIYRDLGYEPNQCPYLHPGTPDPAIQATWKDSWLEQVLRMIV